MSDEELSPVEEETSNTVDDSAAETEAATSNSLIEKFRLTGDEEILKDVKPSIFAFIPMYLVAVLILGAHFLFAIDWNTNSEDNIVVKIMVFLIEMSDFGQIGFMLVMLTITWFNRMLNGTTSGKWTTIFLLIVSLTPPVLQLDDLILVTLMGKESGFIPFDDFNYTFFGIFWAVLFTAITVFYQRSFHYAITNHRVIFTLHLIIPGDGRRILFDNINEIRTQRTFLGALFGYNTIICDTGSQLGIGEDAMSVSVGTSGGGSSDSNTIEGQVTKSILKKMFAFITYQRTRKVDMPDPRFSFFCITNWKTIEQLLNEMHQRHSQSGILNELKDQIAESQ